MPKEKDYDFAGYVTKNDLLCADGVVIKQSAFQAQDGQTVPLVWEHVHDDPTNVLGHIILHTVPKGVYGYGYLNNTPEAQHAKELLEHGDISSMSIAANKIKRQGQDVVHGRIFEVSLVLAGANPGALIDQVVTHSDSGEDVDTDQVVIYTNTLLHSADDLDVEEELQHADGGNQMNNDPQAAPTKAPTAPAADNGSNSNTKTIGDVLDTLSDEQMQAVQALIGSILEDQGGDGEPEDQEDASPVQQNDEGGENMKHNVFDQNNKADDTITHSMLNEVLDAAKTNGVSLKDAMSDALEEQGTTLEHSITNIETLFPEAKNLNTTPVIYKDQNTNTETIVNGVTKSPFSRIKTQYADFTDDEARARGYIKGKEKKEQVFPVLNRETTPQTIYKKQKLDRDDITDITDFDVVAFVNTEMRAMLDQEIARAVLVGDGRPVDSDDKIDPQHIRPIISDDDLYTIKAPEAATVRDIIAVIIKSMADYQGAGSPSLFMHPVLIAEMKLLTAGDGRYLFGDIPTEQSIAARLGVKALVPTTFMPKNGYLIVNLSDYQLGATKGGQVTSFDDFDIDFNQYKYLIETRLSGALTSPKSAIYGTVAADADGNPVSGSTPIDVNVTNPDSSAAAQG